LESPKTVKGGMDHTEIGTRQQEGEKGNCKHVQYISDRRSEKLQGSSGGVDCAIKRSGSRNMPLYAIAKRNGCTIP